MGCSCWVTFFKQKCKRMDLGEKKIAEFFQEEVDNLKFALSWR